MGLRDKYAKKIEEQGFQPLGLSEENVQTIFNRCLATEDEKKNRELVYESQVLREGLVHFLDKKLNSEIVYLSKERANKNWKNICYILGQLEAAHTQSKALDINFQDGFKKYDGSIWTSNMDTLFQLYHLGLFTVRFREFFSYRDTIVARIGVPLCPTLSPKDPAFPAWWEAHKSEWE